LQEFENFVNIYARDWHILGEEHRTGTVTLWFRDVSRGRHYVHKTKTAIKVGVHFDLPTKKEKDLVDGVNGRHNQKRSTIEFVMPLDASPKSIWFKAEEIKHYLRENG
jgi:hypothetical protein